MDSTEMDMFPQVQETLLEFRAGKMIMEGKRVVPDTRKGLVRIGRGEEGLIHIQWLDRSNNNIVEDDQIIFPDEAIFEKINQPSSRVFVLKFHTDDRKLFFWMQEPNSENDTQICTSVNFYLNQPLEFPGEEVDATGPQNSEDIVEEDISRAENLGGLGYGGEAASDVNSSGPVKLADLQRILSNIGSSGVDNTMDPDAGLGLGDILRPEFITPLIEELAFNQELASHLPEGQWSPEEIIELLQSPPFRQQVDSFTYVLRTGQIDLSQFGIDPSNFNFTVPSFLEALEDSVSRKDESELRSQTCNQSGDQMDESK